MFIFNLYKANAYKASAYKKASASQALANNITARFAFCCALPFILSTQAFASSDNVETAPLTFSKAIRIAQQNDPWLTGNIEKQRSVESMSQASYSLPDPQVSIGVGNLAADSLEFEQEAMTQFKVGITQMFPRGDSLSVKSEQLKIESEQYPLQRQDRKAKVAVTVGSLWLDAYKIEQTIVLVKKNRALFEQLVELAESNYSSAKGKTRQQDVVQAQVELIQLEDKLVQLSLQQSQIMGNLVQWVSDYSVEKAEAKNSTSNSSKFNIEQLTLAGDIPQLESNQQQIVLANSWPKQEQLALYFVNHPSVLALDKKIHAAKSSIKLAKQKYQPEWGVTASYAYRDDDPMGNERSDLLSIGVTFDLPLFTENKQDKEVQSAVSQTQVIKTDKILLLRKMMSSFASSKGRFMSLQQRKSLFNEKLVPQVNEQIEAALMAYTHDDGDFSDVIRARMTMLETEIDFLAINVEEQKLLLELNYLFMNADQHHIAFNHSNMQKPKYARQGATND
ncbi:TolC family protein [Thalassotalea crassostreae]|uniref:TolC family protein n=1 Tax=Thalassotalea crassostreae TaxID=1763536 RepID=UPI0009ED168C|nr:TolC family protein [Thalassotalea crassostreae]